MSSSWASLGWGICCSSLRLEGIVHLGSETNRIQASAAENWAHCEDVSFSCCLEICMHVAQLAVSSFMALDIPGQSKLSFAFRRHLSVPMWPWCIICNICGRSLLGITRRWLLKMRPFPMLISSLKFQKSWGHSFGYSGQPWCTTSLRWASTTSWSVHCHISSSLAGIAGRLLVIASTSSKGTSSSFRGGSK